MNDIHDDMNEFNQESPESTESSDTSMQNAQLATCITERDSWKEKYMRVQADFDNFSKRIDKERIGWRVSAQSIVLQDIIAIIDDFDRAFEQLESQKDSADLKTWIAGFDMIHKAFYKFLDKYEVKEISASMPFDTQYHEALMYVDAPEKKSGDIVTILQKGYTFKGQVLRPAKVSVAK